MALVPAYVPGFPPRWMANSIPPQFAAMFVIRGEYAYRPNPFNGFGSEPWKAYENPPPPPVKEKLPDGFEEAFGPRPNSNDFHGEDNPSLAFRVAKDEWENALKTWEGRIDLSSIPQEDHENLNKGLKIMEAWGFSGPTLYRNNYGIQVAFKDSPIQIDSLPVQSVIQNPHLAVAAVQGRLIERGFRPERIHPFVDEASVALVKD